MDIYEFRRKYWGIERILFSVRPPERRYLSKVFTGRSREIEEAISALYDAPRCILVNGLFGIGKTVFIYRLLDIVKQRYKDNVLSIYESMGASSSSNLVTTILRGLVRMLKDEDEEAQRLYQMLRDSEIMSQSEQEFTGGAGIGKTGVQSRFTTSTTKRFKPIQNPETHIQYLIARSIKRKPNRRLIIAIDDLDKHDPATIRRFLHESRSVLHLDSSYILTGHPLGILRDAYATTGGIFDLKVDLPPFTHNELLEMIENYLAAGRVKGARHPKFWPFSEETAVIIAKHSYGIPRVLNAICYHILNEASKRQLEVIDIQGLRTCWMSVRDNLLRGIRPDLRNLLEILQEYPEGFNPKDVPDEVFERLNVDSYAVLIARLDEALRSDQVMEDEGGRYRLHALLQEPPQAN